VSALRPERSTNLQNVNHLGSPSLPPISRSSPRDQRRTRVGRKTPHSGTYICPERILLDMEDHAYRQSTYTASAPLVHQYDSLTLYYRSSAEGPGPIQVYIVAPIDELPPSLAQLVRERDALEDYVRRYEGILSPIRCLPSELIAKILLCVHLLNHKRDGIRWKLPPWYLAHICSRWRACALAEPQPWTRIWVCGDVYPASSNASFCCP
jgi:hypothetical protein